MTAKMTADSLLGMDPGTFLSDYWQQRPLLIRNALPDFLSPLAPDELAGLALEDEIESRVIVEQGQSGPWELHRGPFTEQFFADLPDDHWTLLVQGVDLWIPDVRQLLGLFDFLPPWRLDDIMVSYAPTGGSVGPHFDAYDVFLIQGLGQRQWQIGAPCTVETPTLADTSLRILSRFSARDTWTLNPGDMLYLPPGISHHGIALNDCMTYSVGFRAPTAGEMLDDLATELLADDRYAARAAAVYRDPPLTPAMAGAEIDSGFIGQVRALLAELLDDEALLGDWFARYMTRPKNPDLALDDSLARRASLRLRPGGDKRRYVNGEEDKL